MSLPSELPHEPSEIAAKLAAAEAAQAVVAAAKTVADECQKSADQAIAASPVAETGKVNLRELRKNAAETVIDLLKKANSPEQ